MSAVIREAFRQADRSKRDERQQREREQFERGRQAAQAKRDERERAERERRKQIQPMNPKKPSIEQAWQAYSSLQVDPMTRPEELARLHDTFIAGAASIYRAMSRMYAGVNLTTVHGEIAAFEQSLLKANAKRNGRN